MSNEIKNRKKDYGSAAAYAKEVRKWTQNYQQWAIFQNQATASAHQLATQAMIASPGFRNTANVQPQQINGDANLRAFIEQIMANNRTIISEQVQISSVLRRCLSELIDFVFFVFVKIALFYSFFYLGFADMDDYKDYLKEGIDVASIVNLSESLFPIDTACKIVCSVIEAIFLSCGFFLLPGGCTPGKYLTNIKVINAITIEATNVEDRPRVTRTPHITFPRALARSLIKNVIMNFMFPLNGFFYIFNCNRSVYDIVMGTLVIRRQPNPPIQQQ
uniref:RDD domain-containing protein n=1 Tax=Rhabditophanes sp. KR3021 TaxID=114890 RepID=A0AC35UFR4_9BILA